jgi:predicted dehydrogenase
VNPLRFAVVGCGNISRTHAGAIGRLAAGAQGDDARAELVACVDIVPERAARLAAEVGAQALTWDEVLRDPTIDAVTVTTPAATHARLGTEALKAGKHVLVEKPMDVSIDAAAELVSAAQAAGRVLSVVSQHRFDPATEYAVRAVADGGLGEVVHVEATVPWLRSADYYAASPGRGTWSVDGGGALISQAIHTLDVALAVAGPVVRVQAEAATRLHAIEVEDVLVATLRFASGALGTIAASTATAPGLPARLTISGTRGTVAIVGDRVVLDTRLDGVRIDGAPPTEGAASHATSVAGGGTSTVSARSVGELAAADRPDVESPWGASHERQLADLVRAARSGVEPRVTGALGLGALTLVDAIYEAARSGRAVLV